MYSSTLQSEISLEGNRFYSIYIQDWKQFENILINFHGQLTILTGANGSGKTTLLNVISRHFGWYFSELATPKKNQLGKLNFNIRKDIKQENSLQQHDSIGYIHYINRDLISQSEIAVPNVNNLGVQYNPWFINQQNVNGLSIPSHRPIYQYQQVQSILTQKRSQYDAFNLSRQSSINRYSNQGGHGSSYYIKETLISWAIGGDGNQFIEPDPELSNFFLGFQEVLRLVLPQTLDFKEISIRNYEVVFVAGSGDFIIDASSGGVSALIDLAWQIYNFSISKTTQGVVVIDEIENHLHATMQRAILPSLIKAFPNIQFVVSTHSPLIIGSVRESNVYALRYNSNKRVFSEKLDLENKVKTASEVLDEVLGVPFTMPIWVEESLNLVTEKYVVQEITAETLTNMRRELSEIGLEELMPVAIESFLKKKL